MRCWARYVFLSTIYYKIAKKLVIDFCFFFFLNNEDTVLIKNNEIIYGGHHACLEENDH